MDSMIGPGLVTPAKSMPGQPNTFPATSSDMKTLTSMANGEAFPTMGPCGSETCRNGLGSYRFGHWVWIALGDGPGWKMNLGGSRPPLWRWAEVGEGWCWVPGPVVVRPVYRAGTRSVRRRAAIQFVDLGRRRRRRSRMVPLGPREVYVPTYRASPRYVQNVNVTNTTVNVTNVTTCTTM